jgi:hypothetical protein
VTGKPVWFRHPGLIFKVLEQHYPAIVAGIAPAQFSNEEPVLASINNSAPALL